MRMFNAIEDYYDEKALAEALRKEERDFVIKMIIVPHGIIAVSLVLMGLWAWSINN